MKRLLGLGRAGVGDGGQAVPEQEDRAPPGLDGDPQASVSGERGISSIHRARSLQARVTNLLAFGLMSALGLGLLGWYYAHTFAAEGEGEVESRGEAAIRQQAAGTVRLPPLGPIGAPVMAPHTPPLVAATLGPPPAPPLALADPMPVAGYPPGAAGYGEAAAPVVESRSPVAKALERKLSGPAFDTKPTDASDARGSGASGGSAGMASAAGGAGSGPFPGTSPSIAGTSASESRLSALLRPVVTRTVRPTVLPTRRLLLPEGAFIDCTLETAIDSTLPGMTTCITATDTFGADGTVVLLPRGTELVGETRGEVQQGSSRIFVLWMQARTPGGVVIPLDSPGTDALGRSGLTGSVNRHFWQRFGAAILVSVINGGIQYGVESQNQGGALIYEPDTTEGVMTEALKSTVNIPPTVTVANGARIQVLVAHNIDFRSVYALRPTGE